jgi:N-methylhydantoinase B
VQETQATDIATGRPTHSSDFDPVLLAVIANRFDSVVREMTNTLLRMGRSAVLAVARDFSCSIVTGDDRLLATAEGTPVHILGSHLQTMSMKRLHPDLVEGDAFLHNDPYNGNTHPADHTILLPVFVDGQHLFTVCPKAHQADCGNSIPTTYHAWARDVYDEGALVFPCVKVVERHKEIKDITRMCRARIRVPDQWYGDFLAGLGAARIGERALKAMAKKYGAGTLLAFNEAWFEYGRRMFQHAVSRLKPLRISGSSRHDPIPGALPDGFEVVVRLEVRPDEGRIVVDLRDNADCMPNGMNVSHTCALNSVVARILNALPEDLPRNAGTLACVDVLTREGSAIGGPVFPHSCSVATTNLSDRLVNLVQRMLAGAGNGVGVAEGGVGMGVGSCVVSGLDRRRGDAPYVNQMFAATASGPASALADGWLTYCLPVASGVCYRDSIELDEWKHPMLFDSVRILPGTGGAGRYRGAPASEVVFGPRFDPLEVVACSDGHLHAALGVDGACDGDVGKIFVRKADGTEHQTASAVKITLHAGEKVRGVETSGAGFGDPLERNPSLVLSDIANGMETIERARDVYGVIILDDRDSDRILVDLPATASLRAKLRELKKSASRHIHE